MFQILTSDMTNVANISIILFGAERHCFKYYNNHLNDDDVEDDGVIRNLKG